MATPVSSSLFPLDAMPVGDTLWQTLSLRLSAEPFLGVASALFLVAIIHTFICPLIASYAHRLAPRRPLLSRFLDLFGEVEFVFILWAVPLFLALFSFKGFTAATTYVGQGVSYTEPLFVMAIIALAATKPILVFAERILGIGAKIMGGGATGWWMALLIFGPILGSLITEPAAITITALLLGQKFYQLAPSRRLAYTTLALLFVNISVGGVLTHFAAPPVVMVANVWGLTTPYMFTTFGPSAIMGIVANVLIARLCFRHELARLNTIATPTVAPVSIPFWITLVHIVLLAWAVLTGHHPALFIFTLLIGIWFATVTREYQDPIRLFGALKVGVFLAGLVIFGSLQQWWIAPLMQGASPWPLFAGVLALSPFNDNAALTYLASLVPGMTEPMRFAVIAGAVSGGGLTLIANAPNPAGFAILRQYFPREVVNPVTLFLAALIPTIIVAWAFMGLPH